MQQNNTPLVRIVDDDEGIRNSMAFLPSGSIPYQQYVLGPTASLASLLREEENMVREAVFSLQLQGT